MSDFTQLLNSSVEDAKPPMAMPEGTYIWLITNYEQVVSSKKKTPGIQFSIKPVAPQEDVDQEEWARYCQETPEWSTKIRAGNDTTFWITQEALFMLSEFIEKLGIDATGGRSFAEVLPETKGQQIAAHIKHELTQDGASVRAQIDAFAQVS